MMCERHFCGIHNTCTCTHTHDHNRNGQCIAITHWYNSSREENRKYFPNVSVSPLSGEWRVCGDTSIYIYTGVERSVRVE